MKQKSSEFTPAMKQKIGKFTYVMKQICIFVTVNKQITICLNEGYRISCMSGQRKIIESL